MKYVFWSQYQSSPRSCGGFGFHSMLDVESSMFIFSGFENAKGGHTSLNMDICDRLVKKSASERETDKNIPTRSGCREIDNERTR